jgi:hypothetical protein
VVPQPEAVELLRSIDASLKRLVAILGATAPKPVADNADLDSKYGDPVVKFNPRDWNGESCKGRKFSECPAAFLDLVASTLDYFGDQAEAKNEMTENGKPVATFKRKDAARARGWAKRIRAGFKPSKPANPEDPAQPANWDASGEFAGTVMDGAAFEGDGRDEELGF